MTAVAFRALCFAAGMGLIFAVAWIVETRARSLQQSTNLTVSAVTLATAREFQRSGIVFPKTEEGVH